MKHFTFTGIALALILWTFTPVRAGTTEFRVGLAPDCDFPVIQDAIDAIPAGGEGILRIESGTYAENLVIVDKSVELLGGQDCTTGSVSGTTHLDASSSNSPAISFFVISDDHHVLDTTQLNIFGADTSVSGGGLFLSIGSGRTANIALRQTTVQNNQTDVRGGGIAMLGDGEGSLTLLATELSSNTVTGDAPHGGGLFCQGNHTVSMLGGSIHSNTVGEVGDESGRGGGIYMDGCSMTWLSHVPSGLGGDDAALRDNTASFHGAGLFAAKGATVELTGADFTLGDPSSNRPLRIHNNSTSQFGGAVFARGNGTQVRLDRTWIYENDSSSTLHAFDGANIIVERSSQTCHTPKRCSRIFENSSNLASIFSSRNSNVTIQRTIVSHNQVTSDTEFATVFRLGDESAIELEDSLMFGNQASNGFSFSLPGILGPPTLHIRSSTIATNEFSNQVMRIIGDDTTVRIFDSIIHEPDTTMALIEDVPDISVRCTVWHDDQLGGSDTEVADPLFVDPESGLFYLSPESPAINYCDIPPPDPAVDLEWNERGILHTTEAVKLGPYDLGAYELPLLLFRDRFEIED